MTTQDVANISNQLSRSLRSSVIAASFSRPTHRTALFYSRLMKNIVRGRLEKADGEQIGRRDERSMM
jgi:hypothetical protein